MPTSDSRPITIGVLYSATGVTSAAERTQLQATQMAVEEINAAGGILGREVRLASHDPACSPRRCASLAEQLILEQGVRLIMGCYMSSTRKAVIPIVERHNALLFYATPYEGFEYSRNVFYAGAAPNQNILPLAGYMLASHGSRVAMVGSDYVCPYESNRVMSDLIHERGGEKVCEIYLPLDAGLDELSRRGEPHPRAGARLHLLDRGGRRHRPPAPRRGPCRSRPARDAHRQPHDQRVRGGGDGPRTSPRGTTPARRTFSRWTRRRTAARCNGTRRASARTR